MIMATPPPEDLDQAMASDEIPPDTNPYLWHAFRAIRKDHEEHTTRYDSLELRTKSLEESNLCQESEIEKLKNEMEILRAQMKRNQIAQIQQQDEIEDLKARSMRDNLIFNFKPSSQNYAESKTEDSVLMISGFLDRELGITGVYIQSAHRLGKYAPDKLRPMIARIPDSANRMKILRANSRLTGTGYFITQQIPSSATERKLFALPEYKLKKENVQNNAILRMDKLYVRGKLQTQFTRTSLPNHTDELPIKKVIKASKEKSESLSAFRGYYSEASSLQDVSDVHTQLICKPEVARASHVLYAYRIMDANGKMVENFDSDRDWGTGNALLNLMREKDIRGVCLATRLCKPGFSHIGKKRFSIINDLCFQAYKK